MRWRLVRVARILGELSQERRDAFAAKLVEDADLLFAARRLVDSSPRLRAAIDRARSRAV